MTEVVLYTRDGCRLCDRLKQRLDRLGEQYEFKLVEVDIDQDEALRERYGEHIPVVAVGGEEVCRHRLDREAFVKKLTESSRGRNG